MSFPPPFGSQNRPSRVSAHISHPSAASSRPTAVLIEPRVGHWDELRSAPAAPLGLLYAAALLARDFEVKLVDQRLPGWKESLDAALATRPVLAAIAAFTGPMIGHGLEIAEGIRRQSRVPLVWGGFHPTFFPEQTLADPRVDYIVAGEGEVPLSKLALALAAGETPRGVEGVGFRNPGGGVHFTPPRAIPDLNELPDPPFGILNLGRYLPYWEGFATLNLCASRGCRFQCRFCYHSLKSGTEKFRSYPVERVLGWIRDHAIPAGATSLYLVDDSFFTDWDWAFTLLEGIGRLGLTTQLQGVEVTTVNRMTDDELARLERAGLVRICTGIETGSSRIRKLIRKPGRLEDAVPVNRRLSRTRMIFQASWITAFPSETLADLRETIGLCLQLLRENPMFRSTPIYNYTPYPGTAMFEEAQSAGYRFPTDLAGWGKFGRWDAVAAGAWPARERRIFRGIYVVSLFLDLKSREHTRSLLTKLVNRLYRPIAMWRLKNLKLAFFPERRLAQLLLDTRGG